MFPLFKVKLLLAFVFFNPIGFDPLIRPGTKRGNGIRGADEKNARNGLKKQIKFADCRFCHIKTKIRWRLKHGNGKTQMETKNNGKDTKKMEKKLKIFFLKKYQSKDYLFYPSCICLLHMYQMTCQHFNLKQLSSILDTFPTFLKFLNINLITVMVKIPS